MMARFQVSNDRIEGIARSDVSKYCQSRSVNIEMLDLHRGNRKSIDRMHIGYR